MFFFNLTVATQCLESAYGVTVRDVDAASLYPLPASLQAVFTAGLSQFASSPVSFFSMPPMLLHRQPIPIALSVVCHIVYCC